MSHDNSHDTKEKTSIISFKNSFWLIIVIVGLFIAALNFVQAESAGEGEGHGEGGEKTEMKAHEHGDEHGSQKADEHHEAESAPHAAE